MDVKPLPKISVIVPVYNGEATIRTCVEALLGLDYPRDRFEVIIVDNKSTDGTRRLVEGYPVTLLQEAAVQSSYAARNLGITRAGGDVIAFTDADCVPERGWLRAIVAAIDVPDVGGVAGAIEAFRADSPVERYQARRAIRADRAYNHKVLPFAQTANAAYKREVFEKIGLFDPTLIYGGDLDFSWRMQSAGGLRLVYEALAFVWHRHRTTYKGLFGLYEKNAIANCLLSERYHHYETYPRLRTFLYLSRELLRSGVRSAFPRRDDGSGSLDVVRYAGEVWGWLRWQTGAVTLPARTAAVPRLGGVRS
jgi:cellulose synthase/poly-beta-1,6-N-acetylglucosamine synthase-like glycosyltransferase